MPTCVKEVCVHHVTFYPIPGCPALLSPASLVYHQWTARNPLTPPLIVTYKNKMQICHFPEHFLNSVRFPFLEIVLGLAQINSQKFSAGLGVSSGDRLIWRLHDKLTKSLATRDSLTPRPSPVPRGRGPDWKSQPCKGGSLPGCRPHPWVLFKSHSLI